MANEKYSIAGSRNVIQQKSFDFAVKIVRFCRELSEQREYVISKQLLRSGTSIGANVEEGQQAQSRKDFYSKMCIALKESYETRFWLRLIRAAFENSTSQISILLVDIEEIIRLLVAITKTTRHRDGVTSE